ncbi:4'-phosphopantetheinyl transferase superfamily protein [Cobetia sp. QF-1]|uniref:4'-phosphopantetheinyl transferase family protein n=1 Tax=Cobetia sp. QF-1 TaxID=1969833 RepID=UPI001131F3EE|nr:hypothetical protein [Cobetia sp. QF-1]
MSGASEADKASQPSARPTDHPAYRCVVLGRGASEDSGSLSAEPLISHDPHALAASLAASGAPSTSLSASGPASASPSRPARLWLAEACVLIPPAAPKRSATPSLGERQAAVDNTVITESHPPTDASSSHVPVSRPSPAKARRRQQREAESHLARVLLCELAAAQGIQLPLDDWSPRGQAPHHPALPAEFYVSIAHRHGHVLVGLATAPLGLDLEYRNPRHAHDLDARIAMLPLDARERLAEVTHLSETERLDGFYREWVRYEAEIKSGLRIAFYYI